MDEIWKDIKGYEGLYQVSNIGRIKSFHKRYKNPRILKTHTRVNGYIFICLHKEDGSKFTVDVHRLVAQAFVENPNNYKYVLHLDDDQTNNVYTNLKWGTQKENCNTIRHKKLLSKSMSGKFGELNNFYGKKHSEETKRKISESRLKLYKKVIFDNIIYDSASHLARAINKSPTTIRAWLNGEYTMPKEIKEKGLKYYTK